MARTCGSRPARAAARAVCAVTSVAVLVLTSCSSPDTDGAPLSGTLLDNQMVVPNETFQSTTGGSASLADLASRQVTAVFFGYSHCPDICPTTMADLAQARALLPEGDRSRVHVVMITEDPRRDTPSALGTWLAGFDPDFEGFVGDRATRESAAAALYLPASSVVWEPEVPVDHHGDVHEHPGGYGVAHSSIVWVFAPSGEAVLYNGAYTPEQYARDFAILLDGS